LLERARRIALRALLWFIDFFFYAMRSCCATFVVLMACEARSPTWVD